MYLTCRIRAEAHSKLAKEKPVEECVPELKGKFLPRQLTFEILKILRC